MGGKGISLLPALGTLSSYWVASSIFDMRVCAESHCNTLCHTWFISLGGLPALFLKEKAEGVDLGEKVGRGVREGGEVRERGVREGGGIRGRGGVRGGRKGSCS